MIYFAFFVDILNTVFEVAKFYTEVCDLSIFASYARVLENGMFENIIMKII